MNRNPHRIAALLAAMALVVLSGCGDPSDTSENYRTGYDQGYAAGLADGENLHSDPQTVDVKVSGDFTATVRALIPDYVADGETPRAAVVTLFQDGPFVLRLDETMCAKLKSGESYTFIVEEQSATLAAEQCWDDGTVDPAALMLGCFSVADFRTPTEEEYGLECWRVHYSS